MVTGLGLVSSLGADLDEVLDAIAAGKTGHRSMQRFAEEEDLRHVHAAPVARDLVHSRLEPSERDLSWPAAMAVVAARAALTDAGCEVELGETPLFVGTSLGAPSSLDRPTAPVAKVALDDPTWFSRYPVCAVVSEIAASLRARGEVHASTSTCAAGNYALGLGLDAIVSGRVDRVVAGGTDEVSLIPYLVFHQIRAVGSRCRPFDAERDGLLFGEGAAFLVLERASRARARDARIYASLDAVGFSNDAHHLVAPEPTGRGAQAAIRRCLETSGLAASDIGYVNAHGTGTVHNDVTESAAIARALGREDVPVSSTKGATGHCMGAASAVEAVLTVGALVRDRLPATVGLEIVDPQAQGRILTRSVPTDARSSALSVGLGFGGNNAVAAFSRPPRFVESSALRPVFVDGGAAVVGAALGLVASLARLEAGGPAANNEVATFDAADILGRRGLRHVDRAAILFAVAMATDLDPWPDVAPERAGVILGSALPSYATIIELLKEYQADGPRNINPMRVQFAAPNAASSWWMIRAAITGYSGSTCTGACSGIDAVRVAAQQVAAGRIDRAVAGGVHAAVPEAWAAQADSGPHVETVSALALSYQDAGAWAQISDSEACFDAQNSRAAGRRALAAVLERAGLSACPPPIWADRDVDTDGVTCLLDRVGNMHGAGSGLAVLAAAHAIRAGATDRAVACGRSSRGYATALLLSHPEAVNGTSDPR